MSMVTVEVSHRSIAQVEESVYMTTICHDFHKSDLYGRVARNSIVERNLWEIQFVVCQKLGKPTNMWRKCYGSAFLTGTGNLFKVDRKLVSAKYRAILKEKLLQSAKDLRMKQRHTLQQNNDTNHAVKASIVRRVQSNPRHNPFENLR